jgi:hypothetical protein
VCTYDPASLRKGFAITAAGCAVLLLWSIWLVLSRRRTRFAATAN